MAMLSVRGSNGGIDATGGGRAKEGINELHASSGDSDIRVVFSGGAGDEFDEAHRRNQTLVFAFTVRDLDVFTGTVVAASWP